MFMLNSNEPIKVAHIQKLANQSILNGALVIEMVYNSFNESKKNNSNVCYLEHFFIGSKQILKNLYLETFLVYFELSIKGVM